MKVKWFSKNHVLVISIISVIFIIGGYILTLCLLQDENDRGTFGDMFGSVNALYSGLALAGIIITILLQRSELILQRNELKQTRKEFEIQNETLKIQRFENTFFQMLNLFRSIVNETEATDGSTRLRGQEAFEYFVKLVKSRCNNLVHSASFADRRNQFVGASYSDLLSAEEIMTQYDYVSRKYKNQLGHYYKTYYHILKFINNSDITDKKFYASIARSQLSNSEQVLLLYNSLHSNGLDKFKPLAQAYDLFDNLDRTLLPNVSVFSNYFSNN